MLHYTRLERLARDKHSSLMGSLVSYKENVNVAPGPRKAYKTCWKSKNIFEVLGFCHLRMEHFSDTGLAQRYKTSKERSASQERPARDKH